MRQRRSHHGVVTKAVPLAAAMAALAWATPHAVVAQEGPVVLPARQVTTDLRPARAYNQPQLTIDPTDRNTIAIVGASYNAGECTAFVSTDRGQTWRAG